MKIKVTVELEEGIKSTRECRLTGEAILSGIKDENLTEELMQLTSESAQRATKDIVDYFMRGGKNLHTFNQVVKDENPVPGETNYMRCVVVVKDVKDIDKIEAQAGIPMTLEEIKQRSMQD